jgi:hypothetical protein
MGAATCVVTVCFAISGRYTGQAQHPIQPNERFVPRIVALPIASPWAPGHQRVATSGPGSLRLVPSYGMRGKAFTGTHQPGTLGVALGADR